ncbi:MAG TPA: ribosome biogenesis GTP-binding protein YihA/YsxC [Candidatus Limnocylindrales bacterium]|nr:ribosome biogenesis GTP-binding protein YihA/YsxC [Candidatus Limnocylindrales bacterium]
MLIKQAELKASVFNVKDFPQWTIPEISFIGRSNVGKSSLINGLLGRSNLARTSSTPGKTRGLYFYLLNGWFCFVDLPGYGYARVSKTERQRWAPIIEEYLDSRENLCCCIHLLDCRHAPTGDDILMAQWLRFHNVATVIVATKADKLSRGALLRQLDLIRKGLGCPESYTLLPFSARTGAGRDQLWRSITQCLPKNN